MGTEAGSTGNALVDLALGLREWALGQWEVTLLLALFAAFRWWFGKSFAEADSRAGLIAFLKEAQAASAYKLLVSWLLERTDRWFLMPQRYALPPEVRPAWTAKLYDRTLLLAAIYPIISVYAVWAITNRDSPLADTVLLFGDVDWAWRLAAMATLATVIAIATFAATRPSRVTRLVCIAASFVIVSLATGVLSVAVTGEDIVAMAVSLGGAVAGGFVFSGIVAVACAGAVLFGGRVAGAFAFAGAVTISLVGAVEGDPLFPIAETLASGLGLRESIVEIYATLFVLGLTLVAAVSALLVSAVVLAAMRQTGRGARVYLALTLGIAGALLLGRSLGRAIEINLLFLATLPLLNALFDFGSIGLTRWALRRGLRQVGPATIGYSLLDLAGATTLFFGLGCAGLLAIHGLNLLGPEPVLLLSGGAPITSEQCQEGFGNSPNLFDAVRACPGDYWWLYVTFLSTILPTLIHFMIAVWAIGPATLGGKVRRWLASTLAASMQHFGWRSIALSVLSGWAALSVAAPVVILFWIGGWVAEFHPGWGLVLLDVFEGFYHLLPGA
ncbi:MAG: hypothetical protein AAF409_12395 [Pseudomonadota bacterium]